MADTNTLQQPGSDIRPPSLSLEQVISLSQKLFGLEVGKIRSLNGYDDKNFHLESILSVDNPHVPTVWPHGYVLKIINTLATKEIWFVEAQTQVLFHVGSQGISVPEPVQNIFGEYHSKENFKTSDGGTSCHVVLLYKYQPGMLMKEAMTSSSSALSLSYLYHDLGQIAASLDIMLQEFHDERLRNKKSLWFLQNADELKMYLFAVKDKDKVSVVSKVLEEFDTSVIRKLKSLKTGLIHGDLNESNVLVTTPSSTESEHIYKISGIIDFNDLHITAYIFELTMLLCYVILVTRCVETGSFILEGYHKIHPLPLEEYKLLPVSVCTRLCQSLVMGLYSHTLDPTNKYVLQSQPAGWELLHRLVGMGYEEINKLWMKNIVQ